MISINTQPLGTLNQLKKSGSSLEQAIERLSSGLRINGAKDDAAGQAISNRMSSQYSGTLQAQRNTGDGISLLQTAEGALDEINNRLQRVRTLTVQGLNGINLQDNSDAIQAEINLNLKEIDRLTASTHFNGLNLLDGRAGDLNVQIGANSGDQLSLDFAPPGFDVDSLGLTDLVIAGISGRVNRLDVLSGNASNIVLNSPTTTVTFEPASTAQSSAKLVSSANQYYIQYLDSNSHPSYYRATSSASHETSAGLSTVTNKVISNSELYPPQTQVGAIKLTDANVTFSDHEGNNISATNARLLKGESGDILELRDNSGQFTYYKADVITSQTGDAISVIAQSETPVRLFNEVKEVSGSSRVTIDPRNVAINYIDREGKQHTNVLTSDKKGQYVMNISNNGVSDSKTATIVMNSDNSLLLKTINGSAEVQIYYNMRPVVQTNASTNQTAISLYEVGDGIRLRHPDTPLAALDDAIQRVDTKRSYIGVMTNRLESVSGAQSENIVAVAAARSRVMDADYAKEVSAMSKATILQQAGTAMLAQANQQKQVVLTLLQRN